jgi:uncharacterized protein (TIGR03437 family)
VFGNGFASVPALASGLPLPTMLGGVTVTVTDSAGNTQPAQLYYASLNQMNLVMPHGLAPGAATLAITNSAGNTMTYSTSIAAVSPGLFTVDSSGKGVPAADFLIVPADGSAPQLIPAFSCSGTPVACSATPVDVSDPATRVYVVLYGTGIRGAGDLSNVTLTGGNTPLQVLYAGAQPTYPGLDQLNALLDPSLAGSGQITLQLTVAGVNANPVTIAIK